MGVSALSAAGSGVSPVEGEEGENIQPASLHVEVEMSSVKRLSPAGLQKYVHWNRVHKSFVRLGDLLNRAH